jgi:hypothetical protein
MDASASELCPGQSELSAEQVAAILGLVAAGGFEATIRAQERLLAQILPALAAREELLARVSGGVATAGPVPGRPDEPA